MFEVIYWHWWILAVVLVIIETVAPGQFFIWIGISAAVVGLLKMLIPGMSLEVQLLIFAISSVASAWGWSYYRSKNPVKDGEPGLNEPGNRYVGLEIVLDKPIVKGKAKIKINDTYWNLEGPDCASGTKVKVVKLANTNTFTVKIV